MRIVAYRGASVLVALALFYLLELGLRSAWYIAVFLVFSGAVSAIQFCRTYLDHLPSLERFQQLYRHGGWAVVFLAGAFIALLGDLAIRWDDPEFRRIVAVACLCLVAGAVLYFVWCRRAIRSHAQSSDSFGVSSRRLER